MAAKISIFPVGNGDMTLIKLESGRMILIDVNITGAADDQENATPGVASKLRQKLNRDDQGRLYVDVFLLSHPDQDHCAGLRNHLHLGPPAEHKPAEDKILMREVWSSPIVFRRASKDTPLCADAKAFNKEAKRRVQLFREAGAKVGDGDRILILGRDVDGKTDDLTDILIEVDELITRVNGADDDTMEALLLGPLPQSASEDEEEALAKNRSSVILRFSLMGDREPDAGRYLTGADAQVEIWNRLWWKHRHTDRLEYDLLLAPHHCSWHSLSHDSWSEMGEDAQVSKDARNALSQTRDGAVIVSSSNPIKDDDCDPPCIRAKREYENIAEGAGGSFKCTGDSPDTLEFVIGKHGPQLKAAMSVAPTFISSGAVGRQPLPHG